MITTLIDFEDGTAFERSALAAVYPLLNTPAPAPILDLRDNPESSTLYVYAVDYFGDTARDMLISQLRPLLFGAAWKTLDLLLELAFNQDAGLLPKQSNKLTIAQKQQHALSKRGSLAPLSADSDVWSRLCFLYANTVEARHCLTHRSFALNSAGDMTDLRGRNGAYQPDVTSNEQHAFCRVSLGAARACLSGQFTYRDRLDLVWWIDQLANHHKLGAVGDGRFAQRAPIVRVNAQITGQGWEIDLRQARAGVTRTFQNAPYSDIEIHFPDTGLSPLSGYLEDAPQNAVIVIDPTSPPQWLHS